MITPRDATLEEKIRYMARANGIDFLLGKLAEEGAEYAAVQQKIQTEGITPERMIHREEELADLLNVAWQLWDVMDDTSKQRIRQTVERKLDNAAKELGGKGWRERVMMTFLGGRREILKGAKNNEQTST